MFYGMQLPHACNCHTCGTLLMARPEVDSTFPSIQFLTDGFSVPHRLDQHSKGGGILLYVRDKITVLPMNRYSLPPHIEILFCELNPRNRKWLACCSYNPHKKNLGQKRTSRQSS